MTVSNQTQYNADTHQLNCSGEWSLANLPELESEINQIKPASGAMTIDGSQVTVMDTAGAWLINSFIETLKNQSINATLQGFPERCTLLLSLVASRLQDYKEPPAPVAARFILRVGKSTITQMAGLLSYLSFIGLLSMETLRLFKSPRRMRWSALTSVVFSTGFSAIPIITLLSFMIGVVITYQMGLQLKSYGANIFIVDLLGLAILREFGPLLTAIMVAGRSGSAFTAQLGMMKLNQEIDALDTMGVTPSELLLLPRIAGLTISLPLLTIWADIMGVFGGMVMSNSMMGITWYDFLHRFPNVIPLRALLIGLLKAPVFALIIASVGCYQGMRVGGSAASVGTNTTRSVVLSIFFIIVADAIFSIIFSELKL
jgi:phospholipid/cholesterol/gamma-HCH transport system permease protein